ncbi:IMP4 [Hepatospora eriocheir]|uniref:U3 small nucleolar ribonucleoprotein protein IMP4 n=1 Tax=Hepatospora eriocheir TaxID=1081669 RepID=A0A1X0QLE2_9MICR|nr:IMP4 [Hepatospora eriocheir]
MISKFKLKKRQEYLKRQKEQFKDCLENNKKLPHALREDAKDILDDIIYNEDNRKDEYLETKVVVTTSHNPTTKLKQFAKHLSLIFNGEFILRSKMSLEEVNNLDYSHLIVLNENKGNPSSMILSDKTKSYHFTVSQLNFTKRDKPMKEEVHLVLDGFTGEKFGKDFHMFMSLMLPKYIKETKKKNSKFSKNNNSRLLGLVNRDSNLLFRHCMIENRKLIKECSFNMKCYKISNSGVDCDKDILFNLGGFKNVNDKNIFIE